MIGTAVLPLACGLTLLGCSVQPSAKVESSDPNRPVVVLSAGLKSPDATYDVEAKGTWAHADPPEQEFVMALQKCGQKEFSSSGFIPDAGIIVWFPRPERPDDVIRCVAKHMPHDFDVRYTTKSNLRP